MKAFLAGLSTAAVLALGGFLFVSFGMPILFPPKEPVNVSVPAAPAPEVRHAPTKRVQVAQTVKVYDDKSKFNLKLPEAVTKNESQHVLAATQVKGGDRPQTITTVIDEKTGESQTFVKADPYPWLALERRAEVRMAYGYRYTPGGAITYTPGRLPSFDIKAMKPVGRLSFTYDAIRVKALTAGVTAQVDTDGQSFVGVGVAYRW